MSMDIDAGSLGGETREAGKRDLILDAAQQVFSKKGFHQATVEEIADAAGVGKGTVYLYFPSKKEVLVALIEERLRDLTRELERRARSVAVGARSCTEKLRRAISYQMEVLRKSQDFLAVTFGDIGELGRELDKRTKDARRAFLAVMESIISEGTNRGEFRDIDPRLASYAVEGMIIHSALGMTIGEGAQISEEHVSQLIDLCLHGIVRNGMACGESCADA
ncbi:MAG: TetR/AcrR family transcriptional regulator [Firmicutes bacterium]|nr:TetR/AcrR family transcriptional regulator [Bacillota bacterium]MDH7496217.1 TetR/AcrR family transcriptional regulator [Bacillota bacterium]